MIFLFAAGQLSTIVKKIIRSTSPGDRSVKAGFLSLTFLISGLRKRNQLRIVQRANAETLSRRRVREVLRTANSGTRIHRRSSRPPVRDTRRHRRTRREAFGSFASLISFRTSIGSQKRTPTQSPRLTLRAIATSNLVTCFTEEESGLRFPLSSGLLNVFLVRQSRYL